MTSVAVYSYTHSVTYVVDNILKSLKDIIRLSGLDPARFVGDWESNSLALRTWIASGHLQLIVLEIYEPKSNDFLWGWELEIVYGQSQGDGSFWTDTEQLEYNIRKAGVAPSDAAYDLLFMNKSGYPNVPGWGPSSRRSTDGMVRQSLGSTIEHNGLGATAGYWRKR